MTSIQIVLGSLGLHVGPESDVSFALLGERRLNVASLLKSIVNELDELNVVCGVGKMFPVDGTSEPSLVVDYKVHSTMLQHRMGDKLT